MRSAWRILGGIVIVCLLSLVLLQPTYQEPTALAQRGSDGSALFASHADKDAAPNEKGPIVSEPVMPDIRPAVKDLPVYELEYHLDREINPRLSLNPVDPNFRSKGGIDPLLAVQAGAEKQLGDGFTTPILNFEAQGFTAVNPPDTVGDVGLDHYVHIINSGDGGVMMIYDKEGQSLAGPTALRTLGTGVCANGAGDGIVLYDRLADRWMISEFAPQGSNTLCVYVSQGPDPVNDGWYAYQFPTPNFPDYPKYGVWPDAYYVTSNENGGPAIYALDREEMLNGQAATSVRFTAPGLSGFSFQALTPTDLDGAMAPPADSPNYIMRHRDDEVHAGTDNPDNDYLEIWAFDVDFDTPANSSFTQIADIEIAEIDSDLCGLVAFACFPMPGSGTTLDPLREVVMWRLQYRNFGSYEVLVGNLVTDVSGNDHGGIRWFELRKSGSDPWSLFQEGTFAPDEHHRFMGSIAMDGSGNMALGYSVTSNTVFPGIRYVGRLANDPAGTMPHGETSIIEGSGANGSNRWGDYSAMSVDPADDCTFWYTNMYSPSSSWTTQVTSFKFDACGSSDFTLSANPDSQDICMPADGMYTVNVGQVEEFSDMVTLSASGNPAGTTATFSVNPVTPSEPPATSMLTISGTGDATAGSYNIEIIGMAPTSTHTTTVGLNLFDAAPDAVILDGPADGASNVSSTPTFTWMAAAQAASYYLEVATDANFNDVVYDATVEGTSHTVATDLNTSSTYYWRVRADNTCGMGSFSEVFSFGTEAAPGDCSPGTTANLLFSDDFESDAPGWLSGSNTGTNTWALSSDAPHSGSFAYHADNIASVSDQWLMSPAIELPTNGSGLTMQFWNYQELEDNAGTACYDGGLLEISSDDGSTWTQIMDEDLLTDPYDGLIDSGFGNPLGGQSAWCGDPQDWLNSIVAIGDYAGQTVHFRFRLGTDSTISRPGWTIDDVKVQSCVADGVSYGVELDVEEAAMTGLVGEMVTYTLSITNTGDMMDTFTLEASAMWTTTLAEESVMLDAGASTMVWAWVDIPADADDGDMDMATVTATSAGDMNESDSVELTTTAENNEDSDGVDNTIEDAAPNNGDGNGDGMADSEQNNVASLPNDGSDAGYVTLVAPEGSTLAMVEASAEPMTLPTGIESMPQGLFNFTIEGLMDGEEITVTLYLETYDTAVTGYWKYDEMADEPWMDYNEYATFGTADVNGTPVTTIMLELTDGGIGDADGVENGTIVDPGGPTTPADPTNVSLAEFSGEATMTWTLYGLLALLLLVLTGATAIFRLATVRQKA